jgi:hypothetical protein
MRALYLLPLPLVLAACGDPFTSPVNVPSGTPVNVGYLCEDGQKPIIRWFGTNRGTVRLDDGRSLDVLPDPPGSTTQYRAGDVSITYARDEIRLTTAGKETRCEKLPQSPTTPG